MNEIILGKEYTTRDGREVIIDDLEGPPPYIVRGRIKVKLKTGEEWVDDDWLNNGLYLEGRITQVDLVELTKIKRTVWLNMYPLETRGHVYPTKEQADRAAGFNRIACVSVDVCFNEGDGL